MYFVDPSTLVDRSGKLHKVYYILDNIRNSFKNEYVPHQNVTVDEAMVPFRAHLGFKQFMKDEPVKFGIKLWVLADAEIAYCYNIEVNTVKHGQQVS